MTSVARSVLAACSIYSSIACASSASEPAPGETKAPVTTPAEQPPAVVSDSPKQRPASKPSPVDASASRDPIAAAPCNLDNDCGWDDPCMPSRCVQSGAKASCDESGPEPGACLCIEKQCTLKPKTPPKAEGPCEARACVVDRAAGKCVDDDAGVPPNLRTAAGVNAGPSCDCVKPADGCTMTWFEPVACKNDRECWIDPSPRTHPVARPKSLRGRDFKPCKDGEIAPKCGADGTCVLGPAFSC